MAKIKEIWLGDLDQLLSLLLDTQQDAEEQQEAAATNIPQAQQHNEEDDTDKPISLLLDTQQDAEEQQEAAATNIPQAQQHNEEDDTDKPINPTENGQTEESHGGNESTGQTDSTTNMEKQADNGTESEDSDSAIVQEPNQCMGPDAGLVNNFGYFLDEDLEAIKRAKYVAKAFRQLLENLGSETVFEVPGAQRLDTRALVRRALTKEPLWKCYKDEIKNGVVVLIDNSGSMYHSNLLMQVAFETAQKMANVQAFYMPNGQPDYMATEQEIARINRAIDEAEVVLYIGDFDGADLPISLAYKGKEVLWVCPEMGRYENIEDHDWVHYTQKDVAKLQAAQRLFIYWVDGVKTIEEEYIEAFRAAMLRRRTKRLANFFNTQADDQ
ncbi:MAG: hypothetical protein QXE80_08795 [Pyrobaculum sp.]